MAEGTDAHDVESSFRREGSELLVVRRWIPVVVALVAVGEAADDGPGAVGVLGGADLASAVGAGRFRLIGEGRVTTEASLEPEWRAAIGSAGYELVDAADVIGGFGGARNRMTGEVMNEGWADAGLPVEASATPGGSYAELRERADE